MSELYDDVNDNMDDRLTSALVRLGDLSKELETANGKVSDLEGQLKTAESKASTL